MADITDSSRMLAATDPRLDDARDLIPMAVPGFPGDDKAAAMLVQEFRKRLLTAALRTVSPVLPDSGLENELIWTFGPTGFRDWDGGFSVPSGEFLPEGLSIDSDGNFLIVGNTTHRVYRSSGSFWQVISIPLPSDETDPHGIAINRNNGNIHVLGTQTKKVYTYDGSVWDAGIPYPTYPQSHLLTLPEFFTGIAVHPDGIIYAYGRGRQSIYSYQNENWSEAISSLPSGVTTVEGLAIDTLGNFWIINDGTDRIYQYSSGVWVSESTPIPSAEVDPRGLAISPSGDIVIVGTRTRKIYRRSSYKSIIPYVWLNGEWEKFVIEGI